MTKAAKLLKIALTVALYCVMFMGAISIHNAHAAERNWNGDTNYLLLYAQGGDAWYLDKSSIVVKQDLYDGTDIDRVWAENIVMVRESSGEYENTRTYWFRDRSGDTMYTTNPRDKWSRFDTSDRAGYMQVTVRGFTTGWYYAFGSSWS